MAAKEKLINKIIRQPAELPCHDCVKGCMGDEFLKCKKLKAFENKKNCQAYDYDEAIEVMAKAIRLFLDNLQKNKDKVMPWYTTRDIAEVVLEGGNK